MLFPVSLVAAYSSASQEDLLMGITSHGSFAWNVLSVHQSVDPTSNAH